MRNLNSNWNIRNIVHRSSVHVILSRLIIYKVFSLYMIILKKNMMFLLFRDLTDWWSFVIGSCWKVKWNIIALLFDDWTLWKPCENLTCIHWRFITFSLLLRINLNEFVIINNYVKMAEIYFRSNPFTNFVWCIWGKATWLVRPKVSLPIIPVPK